MNYRVFGETTVIVYIDVEAESSEEALEVAQDELECLSAYWGNGGCDKLIGVSLSKASVFAEDSIEWKNADVI